jgi:hypothetical protein
MMADGEKMMPRNWWSEIRFLIDKVADQILSLLSILKRQSMWGNVLCIVGVFCFNLIAKAEVKYTDNREVLEAVALLFHGRYGEEPYELKYMGDGTVALEEIGRRKFRFVVRAASGGICLFRATSEIQAGLNIEQLDFSKFNGNYEITEACGEKGTSEEKLCHAGLRFKQESHAFCQYVFNPADVNLTDLSFPDRACRPFAYGLRQKADYVKYVAAFREVYGRCAASADPKTPRSAEPRK